MKKWLEISNNHWIIAICMMGICLFPISAPALQSIAFILCFAALLLCQSSTLKVRLLDPVYILVFSILCAFYLWECISMFWSAEKANGIQYLQRNISLLFTLFFITFSLKAEEKFNVILKWIFVLTVTINLAQWRDYFSLGIDAYLIEHRDKFSLRELYSSLKNIYWDVNPKYFNHYTYITCMANICAVYVIDLFFKEKNKWLKVALLIIFALNILFVLLLKSKINLFLVCIVLGYFLYQIIARHQIKNKYIAAFILIALALNMSNIEKGIEGIKSYKLFETANTLEEQKVVIDHMRYEQYKIATHIYNENKLIGVGLGDVQLILMDSFSRREDLMYWHGLQKLNTHSQYLQY
ncbi:MAG: hypothetical protein KA797_05835, partial [Chitinophagales bacterium]|nr:hypothetical protein [Chitinophagales bacterium]